MCVRSGATALLAGAISYALAACLQIAPGEMSLRTPCAEWDLRTLLGHLGESMADLEAGIRTGRLDMDPEAPGDSRAAGARVPGGDPVEVLRDRAADLLCACYDRRGRDRLVLVGGLPLADGIVACVGAVEIAVHGWDVSAARGRGRPIPSGLAIRMLTMCPLLVAGREGLFAEPVEVSPQASPGDRLVAYLGRVPIGPAEERGRRLRDLRREFRPLLPVVRKPDMDGEVLHGMADARRGPVTCDHGEHLAVAGQHIHHDRSHAPGLGPGDQRAHQRRAHAPALPGVGHHHADIGHPGHPGTGLVGGHSVPDDDAAPDGDHGVGVVAAAG
jgi:uncharacterized protein (TIGR03086 family)